MSVIPAALMAFASLPAPIPPPHFSKKTEVKAEVLSKQVTHEFKRCGDARTNSNGRAVDAMGTARHSPEWEKATVAMDSALIVCRDLRQALRNQKDFLLNIIQTGTEPDVHAARFWLNGASPELEALEKYFTTETPRYRDLVTAGWESPR